MSSTTLSPNHRSFLPAFVRGWGSPDRMPRGVNDWDTPLPEDHPVPVILIHGTWLNSYNTWSMIAPELASRGYRLFALNYGTNSESFVGRRKSCFANGPLLDAVDEIAEFIDRVLEATGAPQVDLIGHSQGSAQSLLQVSETDGRFGGADPRIRNIIGLGCSSHGTTATGIGSGTAWLRDKLDGKVDVSVILRRILGQCAEDQIVGSDATAHISGGGDTVPGVTYTMIASKYDEIVTPWRQALLEEGEGATVHNNVLQDHGNTGDKSDHMSMLYSPRSLDLILERLSDSDSGEEGAYRRDNPQVTARVLPLLGEIGGR
ncbi:MAG: esterase/lipase family protein [Mycobacteriaceae bacterium]|uniref:esterase/lipase family protein n=1 Tax=Corynebacterium sp. TaxID=1720 RepID=UPI003F96BFF7